MRIKVLRNWGSLASGFRRVLPGEYDVNDPALFGLWRDMVNEGAAILIEDDPAPVEVETEPDEPKTKAPRKRS